MVVRSVTPLWLASRCAVVYSYCMTAVEIIEEIKRLPRAEQNQVIDFARKAGTERPLTPDELGELARQMAETKDPAGSERLQAKIVRGFYGRPVVA